MKNTFTYYIDTTAAHQTVQQFLHQQGYSRQLIIRLKNTESGITVNQLPAYTTYRLTAGECLGIRLEETVTSDGILPVPMDLTIVYEDDHLIVINKAADMPVHPSQGNHEGTLANGMAYYYQQKGEPFVYRAVNRLDRNTTGLLILAKHQLSASILSRMVQNREIHREYLALADGQTEQEGTVTAPIARAEGSIIQRCVDFERGEYACTHFTTLQYNPVRNCSLIALKLETGRTHQIRVHMKYIGHPLLGDFLYHPDFTLIKRQALHSHRLEFLHPITKEPMAFEALLPPDMQAAL